MVVGGDVDPDLLELTIIWRRGSSHGMGSSMLLVDLLPLPAAVEGVPCALVLHAWYVEQIAVSVGLGLEVTR
jgi:hypothetical protein